MEFTSRMTRIIYAAGRLIAADVVGRVHVLDEALRPVRSSQVVPGAGPLYAIAASDGWVVGKDKLGNIFRWTEALDLTDHLDAYQTRGDVGLLPDEEPSPVLSRGIEVWQGKVYTNNGYLQLVVIDLDKFTVEALVPSISGDTPIEWICTECPSVQALSDKAGRLFLGRLDTLEFPHVVRVDDGSNLHRVRYDRLHDRFWVTQDSGAGETSYVSNGIATVLPDGTIEQQFCFTNDDVECLDFTPDGRYAFVGGFDGKLRVFDNTDRQLQIKAAYEGFTHQISDVAVDSGGRPTVLTQDGAVVRLTPHGGRIIERAPFRPKAVWDIQPVYGVASKLYCATDEGVTVLRLNQGGHLGGPRPTIEEAYATGFGFTRRLVPMPGGCVGISRAGYIFRLDGRTGDVVWAQRLPDLLHTVAASPDRSRVLIAGNGGALELDAESGRTLDRIDIDGFDTWVCAYLPQGERVIGTHNGILCGFAASSSKKLWRLATSEYPKRMWWQEGKLYVTGQNGLKEIDLDGPRVSGRWGAGLINTCENGAIYGGYVYAVSYNSQLGVYRYKDGEFLGVIEDLPDFPKGVTVVSSADGPPCLLVGGRGGYVRTYRIGADEPLRLHDLYLRTAVSYGSPCAPDAGKGSVT